MLVFGTISGCADEVDPNGNSNDDAAGDDDSDDDVDDDITDDDSDDDNGADDDVGDDDDAPTPDAGRPTTRLDGGNTKLDASADSATSKSDAAAGDARVITPSADAGKVDGNLDASSEPDAAAPDASTPTGELCELKGHQVAIMGDSYIDLNDKIPEYLQNYARAAGALGANETYIVRARSGAAMQNNNLLAQAIPTQLPQVVADSRRRGSEGLKLVIMTGGGNDVLIDNPQCRTLREINQQCKDVVTGTLNVMKKLFADMKAAGIKEVIYFWYPDLGVGTGKIINEYSLPLAKELCDTNSDVRCHFVDTRDSWRGHPEYIGPDGIHPTEPGSKAIADLVWAVMKENCLGSM